MKGAQSDFYEQCKQTVVAQSPQLAAHLENVAVNRYSIRKMLVCLLENLAENQSKLNNQKRFNMEPTFNKKYRKCNSLIPQYASTSEIPVKTKNFSSLDQERI